jgi:hypothetical protein
MSHRTSRAFRPGLDRVEDRCLATIHPLASHLGVHAVTAAVHHPAHVRHQPGVITAEGLSGHRRAHHPRAPHAQSPVVIFGGGGRPGGQGPLTSNYHDWGVITIWNTTTSNVTFSISASTYQSGQYFNFTLRPGQFQSYYASFSNTNNAPIFRVSFDPIHRYNSIQLSNINTVFEKSSWFPAAGTEGYPYAIATNVSGMYLTPI